MPEPTFGQQLRRLRVQRGLSQEALAERAGLAPSAVAALESGARRRPYPRTVAVLAEALGLAEDERAVFGEFAGRAAGSADLPSLAVPSAPARRLPAWPTVLVGRDAEVGAICDVLDPTGSAVRLLTLIGPGGVGKTRLAVAAAGALAARYADGVVFVDLAPVREPRLVAATIARALGLREGGGQSLHDVVLDWLRERHVLLVLDNFEQLLGAGPLLAELLAACPALALLVSSRVALRLRGEQRLVVAPLATPTEDEASLAEIAAAPAVRLFLERARAVAPELVLEATTTRTVAAVCRRLEGLPLAIELAAARAALLGPAALLRRLEHRLPLLVGGAADLPQRQRTLRQTLAWSYDLLGWPEQVLFRRLAVFAGGWTLEAAEAVCADAELPTGELLDRLQALLDSSLIQNQVHDTGGEPRFGLLETVREFALEQLEAGGEAEAQRERHAAYFLALARAAEPAVLGAEQLAWLARLDGEHANLRATLSWYLERDTEAAAELASRLWQFWRLRGHYAEGLDWLNRALAAAPPQTVAWARAALGAGVLARDVGDMAKAHARLTASLAMSRTLGEPGLVAHGLRDLAGWHIHRGAFGPARPLLREALMLAHAAGDRRGLAATLMFQAQVAAAGGSPRRAWLLNRAGLAAVREVGDRWLMAAILLQLGSLAVDAGDFEAAVPLLEEGLEVARALGVATRAGQFQWQLGRIALLQGEPDRALPLLESLRAASLQRQSPRGMAMALVDVARVAQTRGARTEALALLREALRLREAVSDCVGSIECLELLAAVEAEVDPLHAAWLLGAAATGRVALGTPPSPPVQRELAATARTAQVAVSAADFKAAQARGERVPLDEAILQALQDSERWPPH